MTYKSNIDPQVRGFYFSESGNANLDGASFETPKLTIQDAIDAAAAISPPPSIGATATVSSAQGGVFAAGAVLSDNINLDGKNVTINAGLANSVTLASFVICTVDVVLNSLAAGVAFLISGQSDVSLQGTIIQLTGNGGKGISITGTVDEIFTTFNLLRLDEVNCIGIEITSTNLKPIDINVDTVVLNANDTTFIDQNTATVASETVLRVSSVEDAGFTGTTAFLIQNGTLEVEVAGHVDADTAIRVKSGGTLRINTAHVTGDIFVESGGLLQIIAISITGNITIDAGGTANTQIIEHVGTLTNNGTFTEFARSVGATVINALPTWADITGGELNSIDNSSLTDNGTTISLDLNSPSLSGISRFTVRDSSGTLKSEFKYLETSDVVELLGTIAELIIGTSASSAVLKFLGTDMDVEYTSAGATNNFTINLTASPDTNPPFIIDNGGTNGGIISTFVGDRDPNGNITGEGGNEYLRDSGNTSGSYENLASVSNTIWFKRSINAPEAIEIHDAAQFEALATAGVITILIDTTIILRANITTSSRFDVTDGDLLISGDYHQTATLTYSGTATFITVTGDFDVRVKARARLISSSTGILLDFTGTNASSGFEFNDVSLSGWDDFGTIRKGFLSFTRVNAISYSAPFKLIDSILKGTDFAAESGGRLIEVSQLDPEFTFFTNISQITGFLISAPLIRVDPYINSGTRLQFTNISTGSSAIKIFDTTGGTSGTFTAVADTSFGGAITSVTDNGGIAVFNHAEPDLVINETVVISGFTTNTDYNGTFLVTGVGVGTFETGVVFGSDETGTFASTKVTITSAAHGLLTGDTLQLDTDLSSDYNGGFIIFDVVTNSFDVAATFTATATGTWNTAGVDQTNPNVLAFQTVENIPSHYIGSWNFNGASDTTAIVSNTYVDIDIENLTESANNERFKLIDAGNGQIQYIGNEPFSGTLLATLHSESEPTEANYRISMSINDVVPTFATAAYMPLSLKDVGDSVTVIFPVDIVKGDTVKLQIAGDGTGQDVAIAHGQLSVQQ